VSVPSDTDTATETPVVGPDEVVEVPAAQPRVPAPTVPAPPVGRAPAVLALSSLGVVLVALAYQRGRTCSTGPGR
jgi:hypothetical protein